MNSELLSRLRQITDEEWDILNCHRGVQKTLYTESPEFVVDSQKLLEKGQLIQIRTHTRFIYFPKHRHNYVEMIYMCCGSTTHMINHTQKVVLNEGDLLLMNQRVSHEILPAGEGDIAVNFMILPAFFDRAFSMMDEEGPLQEFLISTLSQSRSVCNYLHFPAGGILPVQNLVENMIWTILRPCPAGDAINQTTMGLLLMNLSLFADAIHTDSPNQQEQKLIFTVLRYIESHYSSGTLEEISAKIRRPTYVVSRLLKKYAGYNFKELLQQQKLQQAAYLFTRTSLSAEAVMEAVGYHNSSYFYRKFEEKYGMTPKQYRNQFPRREEPLSDTH